MRIRALSPFVALLAPIASLQVASCAEPSAGTEMASPTARAPIEVGVQDKVNTAELGWVAWQRDFEASARESAASGKPIFLLFQEVPGCSTCVGFGDSVLSHPLLIEAIETEFVPVAILNNKQGKDAEVLARFSEPAWNNPVVRFVDNNGRDLVPRADGVWAPRGIASRMVTALEAAGRSVPDYLRWVSAEAPAKRESATFAMSCYWSGEACLGGIEGVIETSAGWLDGREVVEVEYDESRISAAELRRVADARGCGDFVVNPSRARPAKASDRKYHLQRSSWKYLPLTAWQAARVNADLGRGKSPSRWLSPRQRELERAVAGALAGDRGILAGLERPADTEELAAYEALLRARLSPRN